MDVKTQQPTVVTNVKRIDGKEMQAIEIAALIDAIK